MYSAKCEIIRGQNKMEVIKEAMVNFLYILDPENIFNPNLIDIELSPTIFKV